MTTRAFAPTLLRSPRPSPGQGRSKHMHGSRAAGPSRASKAHSPRRTGALHPALQHTAHSSCKARLPINLFQLLPPTLHQLNMEQESLEHGRSRARRTLRRSWTLLEAGSSLFTPLSHTTLSSLPLQLNLEGFKIITQPASHPHECALHPCHSQTLSCHAVFPALMCVLRTQVSLHPTASVVVGCHKKGGLAFAAIVTLGVRGCCAFQALLWSGETVRFV